MAKYTIEITDSGSEKLIVGVARKLGAKVLSKKEETLYDSILKAFKEMKAGKLVDADEFLKSI